MNLKTAGLLILALLTLLISGCHDDDSAIPDVLDANYEGSLKVTYTNVYPPWSVSKSMDVAIEKVNGNITISSCTLSYSGDTIIDGDSKIVRSGTWQINPKGTLSFGNNNNVYIAVDAHVVVQNDVMKIYAKDNDGNWVLVDKEDISETPNSDLTFELNEATANGSVIGFNTPAGSIIWELYLLPKLTGK